VTVYEFSSIRGQGVNAKLGAEDEQDETKQRQSDSIDSKTIIKSLHRAPQ
jgi:hypothetical protein